MQRAMEEQERKYGKITRTISGALVSQHVGGPWAELPWLAPHSTSPPVLLSLARARACPATHAANAKVCAEQAHLGSADASGG